VFSKVILPALISPFLAGIIALVGTYLAYRTTARADDGTVKRGFRLGQIGSRRWWRSPTARATRRRPWA
jgi:PiT family inorganic phosphate transporter